MICDKNSVDYEINMETLREMEAVVPMTLRERKCIRRWVRKGHDPETNPWGYYDYDGMMMNYLQAFRIEYGYCSGPWDYWTGSPYDDL